MAWPIEDHSSGTKMTIDISQIHQDSDNFFRPIDADFHILAVKKWIFLNLHKHNQNFILINQLELLTW